MTDDPIVEEIRRIREKLLEEAGGDLNVYAARLREIAEQHRDRLVSLEEFKRQQEETAPSAQPVRH